MVRVLRGLVFGAMVGFLIGFGFPLVSALVLTWLHPDDPTAGSGAIAVIATAPFGLMLGAVIGAIKGIVSNDPNSIDDKNDD